MLPSQSNLAVTMVIHTFESDICLDYPVARPSTHIKAMRYQSSDAMYLPSKGIDYTPGLINKE